MKEKTSPAIKLYEKITEIYIKFFDDEEYILTLKFKPDLEILQITLIQDDHRSRRLLYKIMDNFMKKIGLKKKDI